MTNSKFLDFIATTGLATLIGFVTYAYRWMDRVSENHLKHIQDSVTKMADGAEETTRLLAVHDARESDHYQSVVTLLTTIANKR